MRPKTTFGLGLFAGFTARSSHSQKPPLELIHCPEADLLLGDTSPESSSSLMRSSGPNAQSDFDRKEILIRLVYSDQAFIVITCVHVSTAMDGLLIC